MTVDYPVPDEGVLPRAGRGPIGTAPYADQAETSGPPVLITVPDEYRPFLATDARSVMIVMFPQHYNFIPNPAFRVDTTGWEITAQPAANAYSWTFNNGVGTSNVGRLNAIRNGTTEVVDPDPSTVDPYEEGQLVYISGADVWVVLDDAETLTVAEAAAVGLDLSTDVTGYRLWDPATETLYSDDSWVGQSLQVHGAASLRYRAGEGKFVYVGPRENPTGLEYEDPGRSGSEWTFSVYARGSGRVRLSMAAYDAVDRTDINSGPQYQNLVTVPDPFVEPAGDPAVLDPDGNVWILIEPTPDEAPYYESLDRPPAFADVTSRDSNDQWLDVEDDGRWHRLSVSTRARVEESEGRISFGGVWWIDAKIEVEDAEGLLLSAVMLDPTEYPECQYFDGAMTEDENLDDFLWEGDPNNSVSLYYFDRMLRTRWLWERMGFVVPAGRPFQIFFGAYDRPYIPPQEALEVGG